MNKHEFILRVYPQVVVINGDIAYDAGGNVVEYDEVLVQAEIAKTDYQRRRAAEYPSIPDQLDTLYHGGYDAWKATIQAVKDKYPKG